MTFSLTCMCQPDAERLVLFFLEPVTDPRSAFPCSGGETHALARLKHYFWDTVSKKSSDTLNVPTSVSLV